MKFILGKLWGGVQVVFGFALGYVFSLLALCLLVWAFEALQRAVS